MPDDRRPAVKTGLATTAALVGFAANSILCRRALGDASIDAWTFTFVRLASGALTLLVLARVVSPERSAGSAGSWASALALYAYAAAFSLAYLRIGAGVGALVLFASVQATMIGWSVYRGERPTAFEWTGLAIALQGLLVLTWPSSIAFDPLGLGLMGLAGVAWGTYSLRGRGNRAPLAATADNFARSVPLALVGLLIGLANAHVSARGVGLALASGAVASGLGYSLWYLALRGLSATRAALVQLVVPVLTASAGLLLLGEHVTRSFMIAALMILGGVGVALLLRRRSPAPATRSS